jgi:FtsX-like permease family
VDGNRAIAAGLAVTHPVDRNIGVVIRRLADTRVGTLGPMLYLLMGAVSLILLIGCVNLANLLLARNSTRRRELALRAALGAGRGRLLRQLLVETLLLSLIGAGVGLVVAQFGLAILAATRPQNLPQLNNIAIDWRVLTFTVVVAAVTSLACGLAPALTATRMTLVDALKQGGRGSPGSAGRRMRNAFVIAEMAMSLMLLDGALARVEAEPRHGRHWRGAGPRRCRGRTTTDERTAVRHLAGRSRHVRKRSDVAAHRRGNRDDHPRPSSDAHRSRPHAFSGVIRSARK